MDDIQSAIDGEHRYRQLVSEMCELTGLSLNDVEKNGNIVIDGLTVGLMHCGAADPYTMLAIIDMGAPLPEEAEEVYRLLLQCNLLVASLKAMFVVLPQNDHCALTSRLHMNVEGSITGRSVIEWLCGLANAYRAAAPALENAGVPHGTC